MEEFEAAKRAVTASGGSGGAVRMMLMDTTEAMIVRADAHPSRYRGWTRRKGWMKEYFTISNDCVHWCVPGAVDAWNDMLSHMLLTSQS